MKMAIWLPLQTTPICHSLLTAPTFEPAAELEATASCVCASACRVERPPRLDCLLGIPLDCGLCRTYSRFGIGQPAPWISCRRRPRGWPCPPELEEAVDCHHRCNSSSST
uniref:Secreted protein n=1 Tax=Macrostomum lignano TaxID=282301 RepID=A0A1I8I6J5_9PLAT